MFIKKPVRDTALDNAINTIFESMENFTADDEEYSTMVDQLTKLYQLRNESKTKPISSDTLAIVVGNLLGILIIVVHEQAHVVTSKALNFVMKSR